MLLMRCTLFLLVVVILVLPIFILSQGLDQIGVSVKARLSLCQDGLDNDGDFAIDFSADPQCSSIIDDSENVEGTETHATSDFTISGGSFSFNNADGLAVDFNFPDNFYTEPVRLFANSYSSDFFNSSSGYMADVGGTALRLSPAGKEFVGKTYDFILFSLSSQNRITEPLKKPVTITLRYKTSDIPASTSESTIKPYFWSESLSQWQAIPEFILDTANKSVTFSTASFVDGSFALIAEPLFEIETSPIVPPPPGGKRKEVIVKAPPTPPEEVSVCPVADFNCDGRVNIKDLSILLYFWDKPYQQVHFYDLNQDGKIDIRDVSILLYYWTG